MTWAGQAIGHLCPRKVFHILLVQLGGGDPRAPREESGLSRRECEVLAWVAQGKTDGEIATILGSKPGTVRKHPEHTYQKLGVETRMAAMALLHLTP